MAWKLHITAIVAKQCILEKAMLFLRRNLPIWLAGISLLAILLAVIIGYGKRPVNGPDLTEVQEEELIAGHTFVKGNYQSNNTLVMFCDLYNSMCADYFRFIESLYEEHSGNLKVAFRHFPLADETAAKAAQAAGEQNAFWEFIEKVFGSQEYLSQEKLLSIAESLGIDVQKFQEDAQSLYVQDQIAKDKEYLTKVGFMNLPVFFLNGKKLTFGSTADIKMQVEKELTRSMAFTTPETDIPAEDQAEEQPQTTAPIQTMEPLQITFSENGWEPQRATGYAGQIVKWTNLTSQPIILKQLIYKFPELQGGKEIGPGETFEFKLYGEKLWRYIEKNSDNWADIYIKEK